MTNPESEAPRPELWHEGPNYTADPVVLAEDGRLLLVLRKNGMWALPGGFVDEGEGSEHAARREAFEETGALFTDTAILVYEGKVEDPRNSSDRWIETTAYLIRTKEACELSPALDEVQDAQWVALSDLPELYGSHDAIVRRALATIDKN